MRVRTRCPATSAISSSARCGRVRRPWASPPPGLRAVLHATGSRTAGVSARPRRPSSVASCWPAAWSRDGADASTTRAALSLAIGSRGTPTTSRRRCSAGSWSAAGPASEVWAQQAPVDPSISAVVFVPPTACAPRWRVACCPRPCRTRTRLPTAVVRRCSSRRSAGTPTAAPGDRGLPAPAASARPRCRSRSPWSRAARGGIAGGGLRCRADGAGLRHRRRRGACSQLGSCRMAGAAAGGSVGTALPC